MRISPLLQRDLQAYNIVIYQYDKEYSDTLLYNCYEPDKYIQKYHRPCVGLPTRYISNTYTDQDNVSAKILQTDELF